MLPFVFIITVALAVTGIGRLTDDESPRSFLAAKVCKARHTGTGPLLNILPQLDSTYG